MMCGHVWLHVNCGMQVGAAEEQKQKQLLQLASLSTISFIQPLKHSAVYDILI